MVGGWCRASTCTVIRYRCWSLWIPRQHAPSLSLSFSLVSSIHSNVSPHSLPLCTLPTDSQKIFRSPVQLQQHSQSSTQHIRNGRYAPLSLLPPSLTQCCLIHMQYYSSPERKMSPPCAVRRRHRHGWAEFGGVNPLVLPFDSRSPATTCGGSLFVCGRVALVACGWRRS